MGWLSQFIFMVENLFQTSSVLLKILLKYISLPSRVSKTNMLRIVSIKNFSQKWIRLGSKNTN